MPRDLVLAELPEHVRLDLAEVGVVLGALDRGAAHTTGADHRAIRAAIRLVTGKVWPELGDLLDEEQP